MIFGTTIYCWEITKGCRFRSLLPTSVCNYFSNKKKSRIIFEDYFSKHICYSDKLLLQYIKKILINEFDGYYSFRECILEKYPKKYKIFGSGVHKFIYENSKIRRNHLLIFGYAAAIIKLLYVFIKQYHVTYKRKTDLQIGDVVYLRRKVLPDAFSHSHKFFKENNVSFSGVIFEFNSSESKYGLYFLSSFFNSSSALKNGLLNTLKDALKNTVIFFQLAVSAKGYYNFLRELLYVNTLLELGPKVIYGSLTDRPYGVLLYRQKKSYQKICMHSDGFYFSPIPGPEYVYSDVFYGVNKLDSGNLNHHGGNINRIENVGLYRSSIKANSYGLSDDLLRVVANYGYIIVVTLATVRTEKYFPINLEYFNNFILQIIKQSRTQHSSLFIIKGKKGEIELLSDDLIKQLDDIPNIYIVPCNTPYLLKYNHFEDLLEIAHLVISMHYSSMTVWQSLAKKIPTIGYNYCVEDKVYFDSFPYFIVGNNEIEEAINYWKNISKENLNYFFDKVNLETNILKDNALQNMYIDICDMVD
jgi:hypothetical protein